uniref:Dihydrolipoamide acetyltransferase component of pyruvate dehydrogenase complex n=1 Tax=Chenopodium quinoa TaxID=63459 RepID=A0A803KYY2_CHEQI
MRLAGGFLRRFPSLAAAIPHRPCCRLVAALIPRFPAVSLLVVATFCRRTGRESYLPLSPSRRAVFSLVFPAIVAAVQGCVGFGLLGRVPAGRAFLYGGLWVGLVNLGAWMVVLGLAAGLFARVSFVVLVFNFLSVSYFSRYRCVDLLVHVLNRVFWLWGFGLIFCWFGLKGYASKPGSVFESEIVLSMVKCMAPSLISGRGVRDSESMKSKIASKSVRRAPANLVRQFTHDVRSSSKTVEDALKIHQSGWNYQKGDGTCSSLTGWSSSKGNSSQFPRVSNPAAGMAPATGVFTRSISSMTLKMGSYEVLSRGSSLQLHSKRNFSSSADLPPHQEIGMPSLSPTMEEGNIARWVKKVGDKVSPGDVICEVETDKATVEMESMEDGYIAQIVKGDGAQGIKVGEVIAITVEDEADIEKFKDYTPSKSETAVPEPEKPSEPEASEQKTAQTPPAVPKEKNAPSSQKSSGGDRIFASPLARKLAEEHNVSLSSIKGTGPDGNIIKADIEDYLASRGKESQVSAPKVAEGAGMDFSDVTAARLLMSKQTIPHYYLTVDTCVDKLMELRSQLNSLQEASGGKRISVNDLVIKAAALALKKVPACNSSWNNDFIRQYHNVNINVAVQTENGLYVPVVRGGTFTVSNLGGPFGIKQFCAIINPPQAAILAVGSAQKRVIPSDDDVNQFKFGSFMSVTLSCDHRVIDGAMGAEWLKAFKGYIENPESMML